MYLFISNIHKFQHHFETMFFQRSWACLWHLCVPPLPAVLKLCSFRLSDQAAKQGEQWITQNYLSHEFMWILGVY